ncbi:GNAT family N-acetyltransferase [Paenarthrobacter nitroguajacolicus]|uniref:GNAT family N-acetyltransferase n=1 Tax=Paenarthrobacter nitroguajacolicus TaxID=211146 RepID=UPI00248D1E45|nr:GNAT family N-acetyltransferase [Paenarthrobacter nitroguajacolicus]MDI2033832.1 N-acetyltransferase Eis [Paenarthrobacter nitroguajacolicus]
MADPKEQNTEKYSVQRFPVVADRNDAAYGRCTAWVQAVSHGFHQERRDDEYLARTLASYKTDKRELTGVYVTGAVPGHSLPADVPVATYATMRKSLNIGFGRQLESNLITAVTVRGTHRRNGILRGMITADLESAKDEGLAMAALTASEGSIYGRFGFGVATFERSVKVDTGPRFRLKGQAGGAVEVADPAVLLDVAPQVFARVHQHTPGSVDRQEYYRLVASGSIGHDGKPDMSVRVALHYDTSGTLDGYVSYRFKGWDHKPFTMEIVDLVAATHVAYLDLWRFLGSIDLIDEVTWAEAPVDDPLAWALEDPRCIEASDVRDMLWLRILDTQAALEARSYPVSGRVVLEVTDRLGLADGTWVLESDGGAAAVVNDGTGLTPDLSMDAADLASIYLGAVSPVTLAAAGRIREHTPGSAFQAQQLFAVERSAHCLTHF